MASPVGEAATLLPPGAEPETCFPVEAVDLGRPGDGDDVTILREGLHQGSAQLSGIAIESVDKHAIGELIGLEARFRFDDGPERRRR